MKSTFDDAMNSHSDQFNSFDWEMLSDAPASFTVQQPNPFLSGLEHDDLIGNRSSPLVSAGFDAPILPQHSYPDPYDPYFQHSEFPGSAIEDIGLPPTDIAPGHMVEQAGGPSTAHATHYDWRYPSAYQPHTLEPGAPEYVQSAAIASSSFQPSAVGTSVPVPHGHEVPGPPALSIDPAGESNDTNPNAPPPNPEGTPRMDVPLVINATEGAIKHYVKTLKKEVGHHVKKIVCSRCVLDPKRRTPQHKAKPSSLERHLFSHFRVKGV
ncbi:hypothetical protein RSAG8_12185, partial [Rhizoctonia solani AG-8 WAC10335]